MLDYISGRGSQQEICQRYGIRARSKLQNRIKKYNGHDELKAHGTGGTAIMTKGKKTTFDERVEIVKYCIAHDLERYHGLKSNDKRVLRICRKKGIKSTIKLF